MKNKEMQLCAKNISLILEKHQFLISFGRLIPLSESNYAILMNPSENWDATWKFYSKFPEKASIILTTISKGFRNKWWWSKLLKIFLKTWNLNRTLLYIWKTLPFLSILCRHRMWMTPKKVLLPNTWNRFSLS